jgi:hypothetical protein
VVTLRCYGRRHQCDYCADLVTAPPDHHPYATTA